MLHCLTGTRGRGLQMGEAQVWQQSWRQRVGHDPCLLPKPAGAVQGGSWWGLSPFITCSGSVTRGVTGQVGSVDWEGSVTWLLTPASSQGGAPFRQVSASRSLQLPP